MLRQQELTKLITTLQVPVVISDLLADEEFVTQENLTGDVVYGLHEMISELSPEKALVVMALSTAQIVHPYQRLWPSAEVLKTQCLWMVDEYGPVILDYTSLEEMDTEELHNVLQHIPEDLAALAVLIEQILPQFREKNRKAASILDAFVKQADAQALIAEAVLEAWEAEHIVKIIEMPLREPKTEQQSGQVIQFPGRA